MPKYDIENDASFRFDQKNLPLIGFAILSLVLVFGFLGNKFLKHLNSEPPQTQTVECIRTISSWESATTTCNTLPLEEIFSTKQLKRYREGGGLSAVLRILPSGEEKPLSIERWETKKGKSFGQRQKLVETRQKEFEEAKSWFLGPHSVEHEIAFVVDVTEGVNAVLQKNVERQLAALELDAIATQHPVRFCGYRLYESSYQGAHKRCGDHRDAKSIVDDLLDVSKDTTYSSVLRGWRDVLRDVNGSRAGTVSRIVVFSDFLENGNPKTGGLSVYKDESLLLPENWPQLDALWVSQAPLNGVRIDIHPLQPSDERVRGWMDQMHTYVLQRLTERGAVPKVYT